MSIFVLVHGAWHGAWCWSRLIPLLERKGHKAIARDLPCHGDDGTPEIKASLGRYADSVEQIVREQPGPVVLVGHSFGGSVITRVAQRWPEKIERLVYIAAFVPINVSTFRLQAKDRHSALTKGVRPAWPQLSVSIEASEAIDLFFTDCLRTDAGAYAKRLRAEPLMPNFARIAVDRELFDRIRKVYVETLLDRAISPQLQERMLRSARFDKVFRMRTGHLPFLSAPEELTEHLTI